MPCPGRSSRISRVPAGNELRSSRIALTTPQYPAPTMTMTGRLCIHPMIGCRPPPGNGAALSYTTRPLALVFGPTAAPRSARGAGAMKIPEILIVETVHQPGGLARVLHVIADAGLVIEHLNALKREQGRTLWEITLEMDEAADR